MLREIKCEIFREQSIKFHQGLNVVLGDNEGSNSIGKSTLLMIIDFVFGGTTYLSHNKDMVTKLGHHDFSYVFIFNQEEFYFIRGTEEANIVYKCNENFEKIGEMKLSEYHDFLKESYNIQSEYIKFRAAVSLFSRVWGKNNYDVKRPLHSHNSEKYIETIARIIKLFDEYDKLAKEDKELMVLDQSKKVLNKAGQLKLVPKITKKKFESNINEIQKLTTEIEKLGKSAYSPSINISDYVSDEVIELREKKKTLIEERDYYKARLNRTNRTISKSTDIGFEKLLQFFPEVNIEKLETIETFHEGISSILSKELKQVKKELKKKIEFLNIEIDEINQRIETVLNPNQEPNLFIENLIEVSSKLKNLQLENDYFIKLQQLTDSIATKSKSLDELRESIVKGIRKKINSKLKQINDLIHKDKRTSPEIEMSYSNYEYKYLENTGTGKAYTNLILFDLVIFTLTSLPFIIHDSFLFKNIEKSAVENLIVFYNSITSKQVFIAIDVINIYSDGIQKILEDQKVIQLSSNNLLTTMDWRDVTKSEK